jgi:hypothetical protein
MTTTAYIGQAISRIDGRVKVTGQAKYAGEYNVPNLAYGVVVSAAIANGLARRACCSTPLSPATASPERHLQFVPRFKASIRLYGFIAIMRLSDGEN